MASDEITYIIFQLFQSIPLSILKPYLLPLMVDDIVDSHEIWWHVKHLPALHVDILENLLLIRLERRTDFAVRAELEIGFDLNQDKGEKYKLLYNLKAVYNKRPEDELYTQNVI